MLQQQHHTRLAAGEGRAMTRINGRGPITRVLLALAVVMLLASGVWTQPAAAAGDCPRDNGAFDGTGSNQVIGTYTVTSSPMSAVVVTMGANSDGAGQEVITVSLIRNFGTSGQTVIATQASSDGAGVQLIVRSATTFTATVNAASEPIQWQITSSGGYCDTPPRDLTDDTGVYYVDVWPTSFFALPFHRNTKYTPDGAPAVLTIPVGATVRWRHRDFGGKHSVVFDDGSFSFEVPLGSDSICVLLPDENQRECNLSRQFTQPGTFTYHDGVHPERVGTIIVTPPSPQGVVVFR